MGTEKYESFRPCHKLQPLSASFQKAKRALEDKSRRYIDREFIMFCYRNVTDVTQKARGMYEERH